MLKVDLDREIFNKLSDKQFLQMCSINKLIGNEFLMTIISDSEQKNGFPETIKYLKSLP